MRRVLTTIAVLVWVLVLQLAREACAAVQPVRFTYQARLTDSANAPLQGSHTLFFSIFLGGTASAADSGTRLYTETVTLPLSNGLVSHSVGTGTRTFGSPLTASMFDTAADLFLQVAVDSASEIVLPRTRIDPVPFAVRAATAASADSAANGLALGASILGRSTAPPIGYFYTGHVLSALGIWTARADMPTSRALLTAAAVNGKLYFIGGLGTTTVGTVHEYDPAANAWRTRTSMPTARSGAAAAVSGGLIHVIGGRSSAGTILGTHEVYNPGSNTWASRPAMPTPRYGLGLAEVNGKLYAVGGLGGAGAVATVEEYNTGTNQWTAKASLAAARHKVAAAAVAGKVYVVGGTDGAGQAVGTTEMYDPATNVWKTMTPLPLARTDSAAAVLNNKLYILGGRAGTEVAHVHEYEPLADSWTGKAQLAKAVSAPAAVTVGDRLFIGGGYTVSGTTPTNTFAQLDPGIFYVHELDGCPSDPNKTAPGICGCGVPDVDTDNDGTLDCLDQCPLDPLKTTPGLCGCGVSDVNTDGDSLPDCQDGCPLDPNKTAPGRCGCGNPETCP